MLKTVKIVNLAYNQEFSIGKNKFICKGQCHVNNNYMTVIQIEGTSDGIHYLANDTNVEIEVKQVMVKDIVPGKKFRILSFGTIYTKLKKDSNLCHQEGLSDYTIALYEDVMVTKINSCSLVCPVE